MQRIKVLVFVFFALFTAAFYGYQYFTPTVIGQTGGTPSAPTGVVASDGNYINKVGIRWDTMRDATLYRIFRNTVNNPASATSVGTTAAHYFFDFAKIYLIRFLSQVWILSASCQAASLIVSDSSSNPRITQISIYPNNSL